tara:strand:+ start:164 stop:565 length:402 start_codon:yes stop_codon:yes gene_type:complete
MTSNREINLFNPFRFGYPLNLLDSYPLFNNSFVETFDRHNVTRYSRENTHYYTIDVPGMKKEDLKVSVNDNVVTIVGEHNDEHRNMSFSKSFTLTKDTDMDSINANLEHGVLTLSFNKIEYNNNTNEKVIKIN